MKDTPSKPKPGNLVRVADNPRAECLPFEKMTVSVNETAPITVPNPLNNTTTKDLSRSLTIDHASPGLSNSLLIDLELNHETP